MPLIIVVGSPFKDIDMTMALITALLLDFLVVSVVYLVFLLNFCSFMQHFFQHLMFAQLQIRLL